MDQSRPHPKDVGLAFPRKIRVKKQRETAQQPTIPESVLQEHAEAVCIDLGLHFVRIPDEVLSHIYANQSTPRPVVDAANAYLNGWPDLFVLTENGRYLCLELKRDADSAKLRASQKRFLMGKQAKVCRTTEEITAVLRQFAKNK